MRKILLEIDPLYAECLTLLAKRHSKSRNAYIVDFLRQGVDSVPGLKEQVGSYMQVKEEINMTVPYLKDRPDPVEPVEVVSEEKTYVFEKLNGEQLRGKGTSAPEVLLKLTGRQWTSKEYFKEFKEVKIEGD